MKIQINEQDKIQLINFLKPILTKDTIFFCIGSDRNIGDSFGPFVGQFLKEHNINHIGNLENTANATNLNEKYSKIPESKRSNIIAIDAKVTDDPSNLHIIELSPSPIYPGRGVGKTLPPIGKYSISFTSTIDVFSSTNKIEHCYLAAKFISEAIISILTEKGII